MSSRKWVTSYVLFKYKGNISFLSIFVLLGSIFCNRSVGACSWVFTFSIHKTLFCMIDMICVLLPQLVEVGAKSSVSPADGSSDQHSLWCTDEQPECSRWVREGLWHPRVIPEWKQATIMLFIFMSHCFICLFFCVGVLVTLPWMLLPAWRLALTWTRRTTQMTYLSAMLSRFLPYLSSDLWCCFSVCHMSFGMSKHTQSTAYFNDWNWTTLCLFVFEQRFSPLSWLLWWDLSPTKSECRWTTSLWASLRQW